MSADWTGLLRHLRRSRRAVRKDVDEELAFHLEMRARELEGRGLAPREARDEALRRMGNLSAIRDACAASDERRERRTGRRDRLKDVWMDLRMGARQLARHPVFALVVVVSLALGIGASTAIYTIADHVLLRPLPYADPDRAVTVWKTDARTGERKLGVSPADFASLAERSRSMEAWGLAEPFGYDLTGMTPPEPVSAWLVTEGFFRALGVTPVIGRTFTAEESGAGGPPAVILSHGFWQRRLGGRKDVAHQTLELDGTRVAIVGVLPAAADYPERKEVFVPLLLDEEARKDRKSTHRRAVARLRTGVSPEAAEAELRLLLAPESPSAGVSLVPLAEQVLGDVRPALLVLAAAVGLLLLVACANASGLLLARNSVRAHELAVRAALGADRSRLLRQMLAESAVLGAVAGTLGLVLARTAVRVVASVLPPDLPRGESIALDGRILLFALVVTMAVVLLTGLLPALDGSRSRATATLRVDARATGDRGSLRIRRALVTSQVALAVVLVIGGGLLTKSYVELLRNDTGLELANRATIQVFLWDRNPTATQRIARVGELAASFAGAAGVLDVGVASAPPFHPHRIASRSALARSGAPVPPADEELRVVTHVASPAYFRVVGMRVVRGRPFTDDDREGTALVALLNQTAARRAFGAEDPVGRRVRFGVMGAPQEREVVGVVEDTRPLALDAAPEPEAYVPFAQHGTGSVTFVVRTATDPAPLLPMLRARVWQIDAHQTVYHSGTLEEFVGSTLRARQLNLALLGAFSTLAFAFATLGVYAVMSFSARARTREIGVRLAVGAQPAQIVRMIVGDGLAIVAPGVLAGVLAALALTRFMRSMLYGVETTDPATFVQLPLLILAAAALAAWIPARQVTAANPLRALRCD